MANRLSQIAYRKSLSKNKIIFLVGPTAVGKSEIAIILAKKLNAEIISCDSMQIYKNMEIITAKSAMRLRKRIKHHLISIIAPAKEYNVARYRKDALAQAKEIIRKGKIPLFVGGTGLYLSVLIDGIFKAGPQNKNIRKRLIQEADGLGSAYLYQRLQKVDPQAACKIHPHDKKRIIRALEVFAACGKPISQLQKERIGLCDEFKIKIFALNMERAKLYKRIGSRIDRMFRQGLLSEVKKLLKLKLSRTASYAIGIREIRSYLDGLCDLDETKRLMKKNTRNYAKRQLTWFRKDKRIEWVEVGEKDTPYKIADRIYNKIHGKSPAGKYKA